MNRGTPVVQPWHAAAAEQSSAGQPRTAPVHTRHGSIALRTALTEAAHAAARTKGTPGRPQRRYAVLVDGELAGRAVAGDLHGLIGQGHGDPPAVPCHPRPARRGQRPENQRRLRARIRRAPEQRQAGQHGHRTHQPKSAVRGHQPSQHQRAQDRAGRLRRRQQPHRLRLTAQARGVRGGQPPPEPRRSRTAMPGQLGRAAVGYRRPDASRPEKSPTATGSPRPTGRPPTGEPGARGRRRPTAAEARNVAASTNRVRDGPNRAASAPPAAKPRT